MLHSAPITGRRHRGTCSVHDTTGQGLFDVLENELKRLGRDIDDVRGQGYDNGSNMEDKHQGIQKKLFDINPRAFYTACGCHSLNLTLCDMTKNCGRAKDFFLESSNASTQLLPILLRNGKF